jgi:hypothetical protein
MRARGAACLRGCLAASRMTNVTNFDVNRRNILYGKYYRSILLLIIKDADQLGPLSLKA